MQKYRNAFTMIELVFVIIILGILGAVAIPKLVATRDDAAASRVAHDIDVAVKNITSNGVTTGRLANNLIDVVGESTYIAANGSGIDIKGSSSKVCFTISRENNTTIRLNYGASIDDAVCLFAKSKYINNTYLNVAGMSVTR